MKNRKSPQARLSAHLRDFFMKHAPLVMHSSSGINLTICNRSEVRLYEQIFVESLFPLSDLRGYVKREAPVVFDVGGNSGFFSVMALDLFPKARVHYFEPQEALCEKFSKTVERNSLNQRVTIYQQAVGKKPGSAVLHLNRSPISASLLREKAARRSLKKTAEVKVISIDSAVKEADLDHIDILKIDVEGLEMEVLEGARESLASVSLIFLEVHAPYATPDMVAQQLEPFGLQRYTVFDRHREKAGNQDLIFIRKMSG